MQAVGTQSHAWGAGFDESKPRMEGSGGADGCMALLRIEERVKMRTRVRFVVIRADAVAQ